MKGGGADKKARAAGSLSNEGARQAQKRTRERRRDNARRPIEQERALLNSKSHLNPHIRQ
jgi:hypothetical protein